MHPRRTIGVDETDDRKDCVMNERQMTPANTETTYLRPHHDGSALYVSEQNPRLNDTLRLLIRIPDGFGAISSVYLRDFPDHEPHWEQAHWVENRDGWAWWAAPLKVHNPRNNYRWLINLQDGRSFWLNQAGLSRIEPPDAQDFVITSHQPPPEWMYDSVMYQIFPDRFARSEAANNRELPEWAVPAQWGDTVHSEMPGRARQIYGGDLDGIIEKLDFLQSLGVNLLYLTPFFPGNSNHRYDASHFETVDELLGGNEALVRLVEAVHARGMRIIGDLTTNHSGRRHQWFEAALGNPEAPESEFYYFKDPGNNEYESWLGSKSLPKFDWSSQELRKRFITDDDSAVLKWLRHPYRLDGWRVDVANMTGRLGEIDHNESVRKLLRESMIEVNPDTLLIAESTNDSTDDMQGDAWHGAMTYPTFTRPLWAWLCDNPHDVGHPGPGGYQHAPWYFGLRTVGFPPLSAKDFADSVDLFTSGMPWRVRMGNMQALDTHDTARFATYAAPGTIPIAVGLSMTLPGVPVLFAGDEFGEIGWDGETSRTPIPWHKEHEPFQRERIELYRELIALRREHDALSHGGMRWVYVDDNALLFVRESAEGSVLVLAARGDVDISFPAALLPASDAAELRFGQASLFPPRGSEEIRVVAPGPVFAAWELPGLGQR